MLKVVTLFLMLCLSLRGEEATYYSGSLVGKLMANGKPYCAMSYTCASWDYPLGTILIVTHEQKSVRVLVTDRHDYKTDIDLSFAAFVKLAAWRQGRIIVTIKEEKDEDS